MLVSAITEYAIYIYIYTYIYIYIQVYIYMYIYIGIYIYRYIYTYIYIIHIYIDIFPPAAFGLRPRIDWASRDSFRCARFRASLRRNQASRSALLRCARSRAQLRSGVERLQLPHVWVNAAVPAWGYSGASQLQAQDPVKTNKKDKSLCAHTPDRRICLLAVYFHTVVHALRLGNRTAC